ncbi:Uncharacterised protein [Vibrio cholerae]|nr:Uncharacterised protein [Vibrio cholerae]
MEGSPQIDKSPLRDCASSLRRKLIATSAPSFALAFQGIAKKWILVKAPFFIA